MTPEDKAKELVDKFSKYTSGWDYDELAKQCALITVNEIINLKLLWFQKDTKELDYWKEIKQELEKL